MTSDEILQIAKFISDLFGLITTLNIGILGAIVTIVEKVFTTEKVFNSRFSKTLLMLSLFLFIGSLAFSLSALSTIPNNTKDLLSGKADLWVSSFSFYGSIWSFFGGVAAFIILSIHMFFGSTTAQQVQSEQQEYVKPKQRKKR